MEKFELYSTCATVTWCGRLVALNPLTRLYVEINNEFAKTADSEVNK